MSLDDNDGGMQCPINDLWQDAAAVYQSGGFERNAKTTFPLWLVLLAPRPIAVGIFSPSYTVTVLCK